MGNNNDLIAIRDAAISDTTDIGRLFIETDEECFVSAFGTVDAMGEYVCRTFDGDGFFSADKVRVAEADGRVAGICVAYAKAPTDSPKRAALGIDGLSEHLDDAMASQSADIEAALGMGYDAYLDCLCVDTGFRGQGIGRALLDDCLRRHGSVLLYCREDNEVAIQLYKDAGFRLVGMTFGISEDGNSLGPMMLAMAYKTDA